MNKNEFLQRMKQNLSGMPYDEVKNVINYYVEYFQDANIDNNVDVTKSLGNPDEVARDIIEDYKKNDGNSNIVYNSNFNNNNNNNNTNMYSSYYNQGNFNNGYVKKKDNSLKIVLIILAVIFSPVLIGLSLGAIGLAIGIGCAIFGIIVAIFAAAIGLSIGGIAVVVTSFFLIPHSIASFIFYLGSGLILASCGIILFCILIVLIKKLFSLLSNRKKKGGKALVC